MTPSEFAKTVRAKHPGAYDDIDDNTLVQKVLAKYPQYKDMVEQGGYWEQVGHNAMGEAGGMVSAPKKLIADAMNLSPDVFKDLNDAQPGNVALSAAASGLKNAYTDLTTNPVENFKNRPVGMTLDALAALGPALKGAGAVSKGLEGMESLSDVTGALGDIPEALVAKVKGMMPNPSVKGLGFADAALKTPYTRGLADAARNMATTPQPELGDIVSQAPQPGTVGLDGDPGIFDHPIAKGMSRSSGEMQSLAGDQLKQVGQGIQNTVEGLDAKGAYTPEDVVQQARGLMEFDADGKPTLGGEGGAGNKAVSNALKQIGGKTGPDGMSWKDANALKGDFQASSDPIVRQLGHFLKESMDTQAEKLLADDPAALKNFQTLRGAYGKLSVLNKALNRAAGKEMLEPSFAEGAMKYGKTALKYALPVGLGATVYHALGGR